MFLIAVIAEVMTPGRGGAPDTRGATLEKRGGATLEKRGGAPDTIGAALEKRGATLEKRGAAPGPWIGRGRGARTGLVSYNFVKS